MPYKKHNSVFKRMRQNVKRRDRNRIIRGSVRAILRAMRSNKSIEDVLDRLSWKMGTEDKQELIRSANAKMYSTIDKAYKKGIIHRNKAARHKAQIGRWIKSISA